MGGIVALPGILHKTHTALTWRRTSRGRGGSLQVHRHTRTHTVSRVPLPASRCCCTVVGGPVKCVSTSVEVVTHKSVRAVVPHFREARAWSCLDSSPVLCWEHKQPDHSEGGAYMCVRRCVVHRFGVDVPAGDFPFALQRQMHQCVNIANV